jgi:hypothetical protein
MAIDMSREMGLTYDVMTNLHVLGSALLRLDDAPRAHAAIRESLALCQENGYERFANFNRMYVAFFEGVEGSPETARLLGQGISYAESRSFVSDAVTGRILLARWTHRHGRVEDARVEYERAAAAASLAGYRRIADECEAALRKLDGAYGELTSARRESAS